MRRWETRTAATERLGAAGPLVLDGLLALAAAAAGVALLASVLPLEVVAALGGRLPAGPGPYPAAGGATLALATLAAGLVTGAAFALLGLNLVVLTFALLVYVYTVGCPRRVSLAGLAATEATVVLVWLVRPRAIGTDASTLVADGLILAAAWWLGDGTRRRQEAVVTAQQRAAELGQARDELAGGR